MKTTPEIIYLTPSKEDPDDIIWQGDQPTDTYDMVAYIRTDKISEVLAIILNKPILESEEI